jgi:hypothetical protein
MGGATPLLLAALLLAIPAGCLAWYRRRLRRPPSPIPAPPPAREATQRLAGLRTEWETGATSEREAAYRLCTLLRNGLALRALDPEAPPAGLDIDAWREWLAALSRARYQTGGASLTTARFDTARAWLEREQGGDRA